MSISPMSPASAWDAALAEGRIPFVRCGRCGRTDAYARATCTRCLSGDLEAGSSAGAGELYTVTQVARAAPHLSITGNRYAVGLVRLDDVDGHVMAAVDPDLRPGDRVAVRVDRNSTPARLIGDPA